MAKKTAIDGAFDGAGRGVRIGAESAGAALAANAVANTFVWGTGGTVVTAGPAVGPLVAFIAAHPLGWIFGTGIACAMIGAAMTKNMS